MTSLELFLSFGLAAVLGSLIGLERQWRQRMAGLRTNALVALGAAAFSSIGLRYQGYDSALRIAAQVVSGIGFLGGGVILREGLNVHGLNTAATLWCSAAVGVLAGLGAPVEATATAGIVLVLNMVLRPLAQRINRRPTNATSEVDVSYRLEAVCDESQEAHIRALILQAVNSTSEVLLKGVKSSDHEQSGKVKIQAELDSRGRCDRSVEQITSRISLEPSIAAVSWQIIELTDASD